MNSSAFDPAFATAAKTADALRRKQISASELLSHTFERIDRFNPKLNAIIWEDREGAVARAKQADEALAKGSVSGALHGVPVTIKESFAYRGSANTWGLPSLVDTRSPRTAVRGRAPRVGRSHRRRKDQRAGHARRLAEL